MNKLRYGAIEAGGTKFICAIADAHGHILEQTRIPTTSPQQTLAACVDFFLAGQQGEASYAGIGIAAFGPLDLHPDSPTCGYILKTPKPQWSHTDLITPFSGFGCPVAVDTDVNAAALAEALQGAGRGCDVVVYVTVGTGIGGGVVIKGQALHGALHPEMGHIGVKRHGQDTGFAGICPFHQDCLEGLASGPALAARYGVALDTFPQAPAALEIESYYLGQLAATVILLLSPQRLILGGGVMSTPGLLERIRHQTALQLNGYAGLGCSTTPALQDLMVAPALGVHSGILGAVVLAQAAGLVQ